MQSSCHSRLSCTALLSNIKNTTSLSSYKIHFSGKYFSWRKSWKLLFLKLNLTYDWVFFLSQNYNEALKKFETIENFALIGDLDHLTLIAANRCDLMVVKSTKNSLDIGQDFCANYSYGISKKSAYAGTLNEALDELINSGKLDKIKQEYWRSQCSLPIVANEHEEKPMKDGENHEINGPHERLVFSMTSTLTILFISTFWFSLLNCFICP